MVNRGEEKVRVHMIIHGLYFHIATFMYKFHNQLLPTAFHSFFTKVTNIHKYNTRRAAKQSYYLPFVRTNYGKFNIRFQGPSIWNCIDKDIKSSSKQCLRKKFKPNI